MTAERLCPQCRCCDQVPMTDGRVRCLNDACGFKWNPGGRPGRRRKRGS